MLDGFLLLLWCWEEGFGAGVGVLGVMGGNTKVWVWVWEGAEWWCFGRGLLFGVVGAGGVVA